MQFWALETNALSIIRLKIAVARENSANFDFLTKEAYFQKKFKNISQTAWYKCYILICSSRPLFEDAIT
jgi:hypothetical protein